MKQVFKSLIGTAFMYIILTTLAVLLTMHQFLPVMAYIVPFVYMLKMSGITFFNDIYKENPDNILSKICSFVFNILSLSGILYIAISHTINKSKEPLVGVLYGVVLYVLLFQIAKFGVSKLMSKAVIINNDNEEENNNTAQMPTKEIVLNLLKGSLFILLLFGINLGFKSVMDSLVKTRNNNNVSIVNEMIKNRFSLTNLPVKSNRA